VDEVVAAVAELEQRLNRRDLFPYRV